MLMSFAARFRQGMKAAIPIWIAFVASSIAWGIAAQDHGLSLDEVVLMSAWVYSGPAQFAVLGPLAEGKSALQVLIAGFLMNLRFLPMSMALAPFFRGVKRRQLLLASHVISASSFIVPYMQFQKEQTALAAASPDTKTFDGGYGNLAFFLGVGVSSFLVWVTGTAGGFVAAFGFPPGFEEALKFILPGYFAGLLVVELKGWAMPLVCLPV
jgi:predicted branched-subunit amino acid permease